MTKFFIPRESQLKLIIEDDDRASKSNGPWDLRNGTERNQGSQL